MRPELTVLEQIDQYLSGDLSSAEIAAFENKIATDAHLEELVNQQKDLIKAVNRNAIRAEINAVTGAAGGAGGGMSNLFLGVTGTLLTGLLIAGAVYFLNTETTNDVESQLTNTENIQIDKIEIAEKSNLPEEENLIVQEQPETIFSSTVDYTVEIEHKEFDEKIDIESKEETTIQEDNGIDFSLEKGRLVERETNVADKVVETEEITAISRSSRAFFPEGNLAMKKFIDQNLSYPKTAKDKKIEAVVAVNFHVDFAGRITEIEAKCTQMNEAGGAPYSEVRRMMNKRIENLFIGNATHVMRTMPIWEPATDKNGNPVLSAQRMYFKFDLKRGCLAYQLEEDYDSIETSKSEPVTSKARKE